MAKVVLFVEMQPKIEELRNNRKYTEKQVKKILFNFARDLGCDWADKDLKDFVESVFDFD